MPKCGCVYLSGSGGLWIHSTVAAKLNWYIFVGLCWKKTVACNRNASSSDSETEGRRLSPLERTPRTSGTQSMFASCNYPTKWGLLSAFQSHLTNCVYDTRTICWQCWGWFSENSCKKTRLQRHKWALYCGTITLVTQGKETPSTHLFSPRYATWMETKAQYVAQ